MPRAKTVEVFMWDKLNRCMTWVQLPTVDAIATGEKTFRCIECKQRVRIHRDRKGVMDDHPEHFARNADCSLSDPIERWQR